MKNTIVVILLFLFNLFNIVISAQDTSYIWWEGENTLETNFPKSTYFSSDTFRDKKDLLSNGEWLTNAGKRDGNTAYAQYEVNVNEKGSYHLWARKFWKHGPFRWRFNQQDWQICSRDVALADKISIRKHLGANWVYLGEVNLEKKKAVFELELLAKQGEQLTACFDCFLLIKHPFIPRGKLKPNEKSDKADNGFFAWEPSIDTFSNNAMLDLKFLNEQTAGINGFVQKNGDQFVLGNNKPVRFWGVNASSEIAGLDRNSIRYLARKLAKLGVNMTRYHSPMFDRSNPDQLDAQKLNNLHFFIYALKQEGIYTTLSYYFPLWFSVKPNYGIVGYDTIDNKIPFSLLYFDPRMQEIYYSWVKQLLTTKNPYTRKSLAEEPAVAIIEIINEDSFFFWTFNRNNIPAVHWTKLETLYSNWLNEKYSSISKALETWNNTRIDGDNPKRNHAALYDAWHMTGAAIQQASAGKKKRVGDQVEFLTTLQRNFYSKTVNYISDELGSKSLISASNWHVTDPVMLDALERYTYTAGDVIDMHGYFGGEHNSTDGSHSYSVRVGHSFKNRSALRSPDKLPIQFYQVKGYPQIISEIGWTNPNLYRSDFAFLSSAYGSLQGIDGFYTFALGGAYWDASMEKFALSSPVILGNFPAYALLFRRGDLQSADAVFSEQLNLKELFEMKGSGGTSAPAYDALRKSDIPTDQMSNSKIGSFDPLSFYVGKVEREYTNNLHQTNYVNISKHIDRGRKSITSLTGELYWDYRNGIATINTPRCQAVTGFLQKAGRIHLKNVSIRCENEYASIISISLDNLPLKSSKKLLIQTITTERPFGFRASNGKEGTITDLGGHPFGIEKIQANIEFKFESDIPSKIIALDENGMPTDKKVNVSYTTKNGVLITLNENTIFHLIQR